MIAARSGSVARRLLRVPLVVFVAGLGLSALRCAEDAETASADAAIEPDAGNQCVPGPGAPPVHRAVAQACITTREPGNTLTGPDAGIEGECMRDGDCTAGQNGRCQTLGGATRCTYDGCFEDGDCNPREVCHCGEEGGVDGRSAHRCVYARCSTDADCGDDGYCSPSPDPACFAAADVLGYYCHGASDECSGDEDCERCDAAPRRFCGFELASDRWLCSHGCSG